MGYQFKKEVTISLKHELKWTDGRTAVLQADGTVSTSRDAYLPCTWTV